MTGEMERMVNIIHGSRVVVVEGVRIGYWSAHWSGDWEFIPFAALRAAVRDRIYFIERRTDYVVRGLLRRGSRSDGREQQRKGTT